MTEIPEEYSINFGIHYRPFVKRKKGWRTTKLKEKVTCRICLNRLERESIKEAEEKQPVNTFQNPEPW